MADYKELLRRAISALPENNGAARRAVYEKARSALVGQLRAINPPLPAREITQHRLQLEDCIRQVEHEASEAVISLGREPTPMRELAPDMVARPAAEKPRPAEAPPAHVEKPMEVVMPVAVAAAVEEPVKAARPKDAGKPKDGAKPAEEEPKDMAPAKAKPTRDRTASVVSIEDIIAEAAATTGADLTEIIPPKPSKGEPGSPQRTLGRGNFGGSNVRPFEQPAKASPVVEGRRNVPAAAAALGSQVDPVLASGSMALAQQPVIAPAGTALTALQEIDLQQQPDTREAEGAIASAIETLDREARGEAVALLPEKPARQSDLGGFGVANDKTAAEDTAFTGATTATKSGGGLTIFLVVFALLLAGAGGAGFWAWREGFVDLDQMFGRAQVAPTETAAVQQPVTPTLDPVEDVPPATETPAGPGNTATTAPTEPTTSLEGLEGEDRLAPTPEPVAPTGTETTLPDIGVNAEEKGEERLTGQDPTVAAIEDPAASVDPSVLAGSQSLLLEASADGNSGAVPFSGTVEWSEGTDELGLPTLIGRASIPARSLGVDLTIRKNSDPSLPASHLLEVDFDVSDTFIGGTISNLPGVLLKDQELVPGTPLVGASARVVGNSFLFALSASEADTVTNTDLLENRRWMDLAVVYGTGRNAILTLEKDETAQALFDKVFTTWSE